MKSDCLPVFHHRCGRREVVTHPFGRGALHRDTCPDCARIDQQLQKRIGEFQP